METPSFSHKAVLMSAFRYSIPVLLGYMAIGIAFGLVISEIGYPWWFASVMSIWMFAGAGQFIAAGFFTAGIGILQACVIQLVVNARHIAYGLSMFKRFEKQGSAKPYLIFSLTDETFALLSSINENGWKSEKEKRFFMVSVAILNHSYWVLGSTLGAVAGALIPYDFEGVSFALTALFVVLMIEQMKRTKRPLLFIVSGTAALLGVFLLSGTISLLAALVFALVIVSLFERKNV